MIFNNHIQNTHITYTHQTLNTNTIVTHTRAKEKTTTHISKIHKRHTTTKKTAIHNYTQPRQHTHNRAQTDTTEKVTKKHI